MLKYFTNLFLVAWSVVRICEKHYMSRLWNSQIYASLFYRRFCKHFYFVKKVIYPILLSYILLTFAALKYYDKT